MMFKLIFKGDLVENKTKIFLQKTKEKNCSINSDLEFDSNDFNIVNAILEDMMLNKQLNLYSIESDLELEELKK